MPQIVGVRFKRAAKVYYFDPAGFTNLKVGEYVIVETTRGREAGCVAIAPTEVADSVLTEPLKPILRRADPRDLTLMQRYRFLESRALEKACQKVAEHKLPMKLIRAEYSYDGTHLTIFFTAEKRVDFRELLRDLSRTLKTRIELRQIGMRDVTKLMGGIGPCGRILCCDTFLSEFAPVSITMVKDQDLPLNPSDISGMCGRLRCCLRYEVEAYRELRHGLPKVGEGVTTSRGHGKIVAINVVKETVSVELDNKETIEVPAEELRRG